MRSFHRFLPLCGLLALSSASFGATILVTPPQSVAPANSTAIVRVGFSNIADLYPQALAAYDISITYDPSLLILQMVTHGDDVYGNQLDLSGFGTLAFDDAGTPGTLRVLELSFDSTTVLNTMQQREFGLLSILFQTQGQGVSPLMVDVNMLSDPTGLPIEVAKMNGQVAVVPEPGMLVMLGSGLAGLGLWNRRRKQQKSTPAA